VKFFLFWGTNANPTPDKIMAEAMKSRRLKGSAKNKIPPAVAITGTVNWTLAARSG